MSQRTVNEWVMRISLILFALMAGPVGPTLCLAEDHITVSLSPSQLPDTSFFPSARPLTFGNPLAAQLPFPKEWAAVDAVPILNIPQYKQAWLFRYRKGSAEDLYAYGAPGSVKVSDENRLTFTSWERRKVANLVIPLITRDSLSKTVGEVAIQIIDSGQVAMRVSECREGSFQLDGVTYPVRLVLFNPTIPYFSLRSGTACFIDQTGKNDFSPLFRFDSDSGVVASTRVSLTGPFLLGGKKFQAASLDSTGSNLTIAPYAGSDTAMAVGFVSPDWSTVDLDGEAHSLAAARGKVTLLLFWSVTCPHCERIRPVLNTLVADLAGEKFQSIACCLDGNPGQIKEFLGREPYSGIVVPFDQVMWQKFNRSRSTPAIFVLDQQGVIRFVGTGESMYYIADKIVRNLLAQQ